MTNPEKWYEDELKAQKQRKITPKLVSYTLVSQGITVLILGGLAYLFVLWMDTTTKGISEVHTEISTLASTINERHADAVQWKQATTDHVNSIDMRLTKVETNLGI